MAASGDSWTREYNEAEQLADIISKMISERSSLPLSERESQRHLFAIRAKITILGTRLDMLQSLTEKEVNRRKDMITNLRSNVNEMTYALNMSNFANRDSLLEPDSDAISRTIGLDNQGLVDLQRQILREQDEGLERLVGTTINTRHIALAVNEELGLHTRLVDNADEHVEVTDSRQQSKVQERLAILKKQTKDRCFIVVSIIAIVALVAILYILIKYL